MLTKKKLGLETTESDYKMNFFVVFKQEMTDR